ncbi:MAG: hypothetical protein AAFS10_25585, partial [Myxococcota bacterium]
DDSAAALWLDRPYSLSSLLTASQTLEGSTPQLKTSAGAYALMPIRVEQMVRRPWPLELEMEGVPPEVKRIKSGLEYPLTQCHLLEHPFQEGTLSSPFTLSPGVWTEVPEGKPLDSVDQLWLPNVSDSPLHHAALSLSARFEELRGYSTLICEAPQPLLDNDPTGAVGGTDVERRTHPVMRFVWAQGGQ